MLKLIFFILPSLMVALPPAFAQSTHSARRPSSDLEEDLNSTETPAPETPTQPSNPEALLKPVVRPHVEAPPPSTKVMPSKVNEDPWTGWPTLPAISRL